MYIIIEGMPGTGKTTIARELSNRLNANYMKSVLSDTKFGDALKIVRKKDRSIDLELMILSDLALDELRVVNYLKQGDLVRDKAITATLGHLCVHGYENDDQDVVDAIKKGYCQLEELVIQPDIAIHLKRDKDKVFDNVKGKKDLSAIDKELLDNYDVYEKQDIAIESYMKKIYGDRFMSLTCFSGSVDEMIDIILEGICYE